MKYWTLIWLIVTSGPDGTESRLYESNIMYPTLERCMFAEANLAQHLLDEGYTNFTVTCEEREIVR